MNELEKILIVDDEEHILRVYSGMLEDLGYFVKTATDRNQAINAVKQEKFDVAFLDQFVGKDRGLELMAEMRTMDPEMFFVIITANGSADLAVESLKKGAADFISKPFFMADMIKSIDHVGSKREMENQRKTMLSTLKQKVEEKEDELKKVYLSVLASLALAMEKRDVGTYGHSRRVSHISKLISATLDISDEDRENLKVAALLHDIGKIGISDFIIGKVDALNQTERDVIKSHPQKGVEILKPLKQFKAVLPAILHHHEKFDGTGYPAGLKGKNIPLHARIICVADTYDAILSNRPYRSGSSHEAAMKELQRCSGTHFDPDIVNAFVETDKKYRYLFILSMEDLEEAKI